MAISPEKLAGFLAALQSLQERGIVAVRAGDLARTHRERLARNGFLQPVMKGWYIAGSPDQGAGDSTGWYTSFWGFCSDYLRVRLGTDWCLSPEQCLSLHAGIRSVPRQLLVRAPRGRNNVTNLPHDTSVLEVRAVIPNVADIVELEGMRVFRLPAALVACSARFFSQNLIDARTALALVDDAPDMVRRLLAGGHSTVAGRLAGAFRGMGRERIANEIVEAMRAAGFTIRETDPFEAHAPTLQTSRDVSPSIHRIRLIWETMRRPIAERFPRAPGRPEDVTAYLKRIEDAYVTDAYHSLSIEGYRVSPAMIEVVRGGAWNPDHNEDDRVQRDALAARGYWQACQVVRGSVRRVLEGENPGAVAEEDHGTWYREMFALGVVAGLVRPADLAGYRNAPVYIRRSMHVPPNPQAVRDAMPAFFDLLRNETEPSVRVVLGHFMFVYIHPYSDGNGRVGRFLMNVMLGGRLPVDGHSGRMAGRLHGGSRRRERPPGDRSIHRLPCRTCARGPGGESRRWAAMLMSNSMDCSIWRTNARPCMRLSGPTGLPGCGSKANSANRSAGVAWSRGGLDRGGANLQT